jgi:hypothetical protein
MTAKTDHARTAVLRQLAERHEHFAERHQVLHAEGRVAEAEGALQYVRWVRRALDAEMHDPPVAHKA